MTHNFNNGNIRLRQQGRSFQDVVNGFDALFTELKSRQSDAKFGVVVNGGTSSTRADLKNNWTDEHLSAWGVLKKKHNHDHIWRVDLNELPEVDKVLVDRARNLAGVDYLALGAELWLNKYAGSGDLSKAEVTERTTNMTVQKYGQMCAEYLPLYADVDTFIIMAAPEKGGARMRNWNNALPTIVAQLEQQFGKKFIIGLHVYPRGSASNWNAPASIQRLQGLFPNHPIWILEGGMADDGEGAVTTDSPEQVAAAEVELFTNIRAVLRPQDRCGDHCGVHMNNALQGWLSVDGWTLKGLTLRDALFPAKPKEVIKEPNVTTPVVTPIQGGIKITGLNIKIR